MGQYSREISKRIQHTRIKEGYCLICGKFGALSKDHVPPQGSIQITKVEQKHITELMGDESNSLKGVKAKNGSIFKTICSACNNEILGKNDSEISRVHKELTVLIRAHFEGPLVTPTMLSLDIDAIRYARAMIGHILAATSVSECRTEPVDAPYLKPLQEFVLGENDAIENTHDIYYWFYPHKKHLSAKMVGFHNEGNMTILSLLSFFPVAFLVTQKGKGTYPAHARRLKLTDRKMHLSLSMHNAKFVDFPFIELTGNSFYLLADQQCIVSYPVKE
ncbi:metal-binding protein [Idiomarina loihiensis]|uniref:metal-binding protein n=1 Tax=Idiomarina loihiensis TaxID=135577 RepID=UPI00129C6F56|nr:metal-binding protein [Idiomarina loihiensis]MRJ45894.1 metal-binding protein [Idiomarina loihiensis]UTW33456.1 metal-binding protein [Idiomarina loihiensis]